MLIDFYRPACQKRAATAVKAPGKHPRCDAEASGTGSDSRETIGHCGAPTSPGALQLLRNALSQRLKMAFWSHPFGNGDYPHISIHTHIAAIRTLWHHRLMKLDDQDTAVVNILFVCLGNVCRSPMAEGLLRHMVRQAGLVKRFTINSAGLGSWHVGHPPDERAREALAIRGVEISDLRARQIASTDFETFDVIVAMDRSNRQSLIKLSPVSQQHKIRLLMEYAPNLGVREIPDPFFGGRKGFDYVTQMIDTGCRGLLQSYLPRSRMTPSSCSMAPLKG